MNPLNPILQHLRTAALLLLCCLLVSGCFQPEGENFIPVGKPQLGSVDITLTDEISELYLYQPSRISYKVEDGDYQLIRIEGLIDGISLFDPKRPTIVFIDPAKLTNGNHTLRIVATFVSNSGTLAASLGKETQTFSKDFTVIVDLEEPEAINISKIEPLNGSLYVSFETPEKNNFINYQVHRYTKPNGTWQEDLSSQWFLSPDKTGFNDSLYIGGEVQYRIDIHGYKFTTEGVPSDVNYKMIDPVIEQTGDNTVKVSWARSLFYNNLDQFRVGEYNKPDLEFDATQAVSYTSDIAFGAPYLQYVSATGKYNSYSTIYFDKYIGERLTFEGLSSDYRNYMHFGSKELIVNTQQPPDAILANSSTHSIIKTLDLTPYYANAKNEWAIDRTQIGITPDGNNFYLFTGSEVSRFDANLNFIEEIDFTNVIPVDLPSFAYNVRLSNNNIAVFNLFAGRIGIVDLENKNVITDDILDNGMPFNISPNGKFVFYNKRVYDITSGALVEVKNFDAPSYNLREAQFSNNSDKLFLSYDGGHFRTIDTSTMTVVSEFDLPDPGTYTLGAILYDPISGLCGVQNNWPGSEAELIIFNPITQQIVKRLRISAICHLYNNTLYSDQKFALPL